MGRLTIRPEATRRPAQVTPAAASQAEELNVMDGPLDTAFRKDGFVLVPDVVPPAELARLRAAAERLIESCRSGRHTTVRRSPRQEDMWGAGQLFQPTCFEP